MVNIIRDFILATDGFWYEISKNQSEQCVCIECSDGKNYTVKLEKYIVSNNGFLYKILENNEVNGKLIIGRDNKRYFVEKFG